MPLGVCLAQIGTPDAPSPAAVRRYLAAFLSDRRLIDLHPVLWWPVLHGIVLRVRPRRSAALYRRIWTAEGSPLRVHTEAQAEGLGARLGAAAKVVFGMRIGRPSIAEALEELVAAGCDPIRVQPLFPQYSRTTSASVEDAVEDWRRARAAAKRPCVEVLGSFPDEAAYVAALARSVRETGFEPGGGRPLVISFHGIPKRYAARGDPYPEECRRTARALADALGLEPTAWVLTYQSRFGTARWLEPSTTGTLRTLAQGGVRTVGIVTPSFVADCLETIDEIGREARHGFEEAGGTEFVRVPCLNAAPGFLDALASLVQRKLPGHEAPQA